MVSLLRKTFTKKSKKMTHFYSFSCFMVRIPHFFCKYFQTKPVRKYLQKNQKWLDLQKNIL